MRACCGLQALMREAVDRKNKIYKSKVTYLRFLYVLDFLYWASTRTVIFM